jgi:uncharacterized cupin superfamily protein
VVVPVDRPHGELYGHVGEEWLYVLSGRLRLVIGTTESELTVGDAAQFDASTPHRLFASGAEDAVLLLVAARVPAPLFTSYRGGSR